MSLAKETPRQKMIGMMYLVLTALLALNVSKDILNAFIVVNKGLENINIAIEKYKLLNPKLKDEVIFLKGVLLSQNKSVTSDVRGNLGPPSVITSESTEDWLKDRWQGMISS